jgi:hypothetical protein
MNAESVNILADAIKEYYGDYELEELCSKFNLEMDYLGVSPNHKKLASKLIAQGDNNHRRFLAEVLTDLLKRCNHRILNSTWESNVFDEEMLRHLKKLQILIAPNKKSLVGTEPDNYIFKLKTDVIKFFSAAKTAVTIVDTCLSGDTLECLINIKHPIRLLTGKEEHTLSDDFDTHLRKFRSSGHAAEVRRHIILHDRFVFFNGRCWLLNASILQAGENRLSLIECIDAKSAIAREIEGKWREAEIY